VGPDSFDAGYGYDAAEAFEPMLRRLFARKPFTYGPNSHQ